MTDNTFTRVDLNSFGTCAHWLEYELLAALRAACAEVDRLRALVPVWTTYDGTQETLPPVGRKIYQISAYHHEFMGFRESETMWGEIWGGGYRLWLISVGERWTPAIYDPDPPKYRKVEEGEVKA